MPEAKRAVINLSTIPPALLLPPKEDFTEIFLSVQVFSQLHEIYLLGNCIIFFFWFIIG